MQYFLINFIHTTKTQRLNHSNDGHSTSPSNSETCMVFFNFPQILQATINFQLLCPAESHRTGFYRFSGLNSSPKQSVKSSTLSFHTKYNISQALKHLPTKETQHASILRPLSQLTSPSPRYCTFWGGGATRYKGRSLKMFYLKADFRFFQIGLDGIAKRKMFQKSTSTLHITFSTALTFWIGPNDSEGPMPQKIQ